MKQKKKKRKKLVLNFDLTTISQKCLSMCFGHLMNRYLLNFSYNINECICVHNNDRYEDTKSNLGMHGNCKTPCVKKSLNEYCLI